MQTDVDALLEVRVRTYPRAVVVLLSMFAVLVLWSHPARAQKAAEIIHRSAEANDRDWAAVPEFDNYERDRNKAGDKTYDVTMLYGSPYNRLIAVNGRPLSSSQQKEQQKKYEDEWAKRRHESSQQKSERVAKYQAERKRDHTLIEQLTIAFDFHLVGQKQFNGHKVYVLKATPRKGYKPPDRDSEVLPGMNGTLWIDQQTFQWVKVEAHVIHPVRIEGFLAEVEPGTRFELEKKPVTDDIWFGSHFSMRSNAKVMLLIPHKGEEDVTYFNYRRTKNSSEK